MLGKLNINQNFKEHSLWGITLLFLIWSGIFIYRTSFVGWDGQRYFCLFDDAMISMRYAWNFSHGLGLVWNPGTYLEGYTNLLMVLYMSLATLIFNKSTAVLFIQISGIMFMLATAYLTMKIADKLYIDKANNKDFYLVLSFALALTYYPLVYWSLMGMETGLLTVLLLASTLLALSNDHEVKIKPILPIIMGLAILTRPDALIPISIIILYRAISMFRHRKGMQIILIETAIVGSFVIASIIFRWLYYGEIAPNTYTLKIVGMPFLERIKNGLGFILPFLMSILAVFFISLLSTFFNFRKEKLLVLSLFVSSVAYNIWIGGDPWPYWRMMSPFMPLLFVLCLGEIMSIVNILYKSNVFISYISRNPIIPISYTPRAIVIGILFMLVLMANFSFLPDCSLISLPYHAAGNHRNVNTAIAINEVTTEQASVAVFWAGSIPYYTGRESIDMLGKADRYIASLAPDISGAISWDGMKSVPGHNKYDLNYSIRTLKPTYVQSFTWGKDDLTAYGKEHYERVPYKGITLNLKKDSPDVRWEVIKAQ